LKPFRTFIVTRPEHLFTSKILERRGEEKRREQNVRSGNDGKKLFTFYVYNF
jgi:hypothetical protein